MASKKVVCTHCGLEEFIKKGTNKSNTARLFLCKSCGRRFTVNKEDLVGTPYAMDGDVVAPSVAPKKEAPKKESVVKAPSKVETSSSAGTGTNVNNSNFDMSKAKTDKNGNYLLRIGRNGIVNPVGTSYNDLMRVVNSKANCTLVLDDDGIFTLLIGVTTKGVDTL